MFVTWTVLFLPCSYSRHVFWTIFYHFIFRVDVLLYLVYYEIDNLYMSFRNKLNCIGRHVSRTITIRNIHADELCTKIYHLNGFVLGSMCVSHTVLTNTYSTYIFRLLAMNETFNFLNTLIVSFFLVILLLCCI